MNSRPGQSQPHLQATFYPGGNDDFYMPEVISPEPQRTLSELPAQIQDNLAHLELEARSVSRSGIQSPDSMYHQPLTQRPLHQNNERPILQDEPPEARSYGVDSAGQRQPSQPQNLQRADTLEEPSFSPFPRLNKRPPNVPPSDEEKENILESARDNVLNSNDPEVQLTWAQDALVYVEVAQQNEIRMSELQAPRSNTPRIEHQLRTDAVNVVSFLADQHHPKAEFMRGIWLEFGKFGFRMDKKEAYRCYQRAAQMRYMRAEYRMGMLFEASNEIPKAVKHYNIGVEGGDSASYYRLGMMTLLGQHDQPQDYRRGMDLIKRAADTADENAPQGAYIYGMLQARELPQVSVPEQFLQLDIDSALYNIEKAAYLGFAKAQTKMGAAYELCQLGCQFDPALSLHYNNLAARQGEPEAEMAISKWFLCGYEGVFKKMEELAFKYAQRAAQANLATAEFAMGYFWEVGIHVSVNYKEARDWYSRAAEHGNKDAAARVEGISRSKTLSRKDHERIAVAKITSARGAKRPGRSTAPVAAMPDLPPMPNLPYVSASMPNPQPPRPNYTNPSPYPPSPVTPSSYAGSAFTSPNIPPTSNFRPDPHKRPVSAATTGAIPIDGRYNTSSPATSAPQRPYSGINDPNSSFGRGVHPQRMGPGTQNPQSYPQKPPQKYSQQPTQNHSQQPPQNYLPQPQSLPATPRPPQGLPQDARQKPLPTIDIGFTAPPDPSGADRKKRLALSDQPGPLPPARGYDARPERKSSRPPVDQGYGQNRPPLPNGQSLNSHPVHESSASINRPPRHESMPIRHGGAPISNPTPPPVKVAANSAPPSNTAVGGRRPGKGPSTFEEMGVPANKKDDECVIM